jgi:hexosaminidase
MNRKSLFFYCALLLSLQVWAQTDTLKLPLIPRPAEINITAGSFKISLNTHILAEPKLLDESKYLRNYILANHQIPLLNLTKASNQIVLRINKSLDKNKESYRISSSAKQIIIEASEPNGIFYGIQTIIQLLPDPKNKATTITIPLVQIADKPNYTWRGMHLDCSRHFFTTAFIKKYLDMMAYYKMNTFHWHLTDDQGWRIEIKKYPKLTEVGAWRNGSMIGHYRDQKFDSIRYGGFYTQDEAKEIVAYAQKLHIDVVPEIEMPGHALAALAAYPEFSCSKQATQVGMRWGVETNVFCPTEETFTFLNHVLNEVMEIFPSKYVHIGGDEVPKEEWEKSAFCQKLMEDNKLKDAHELQSYFIRRIEKMVNQKGKIIIGWDEILEGGLAPNAVVMSWRGTDGGIAAAKMGHDVVMTPGSHCYFDHYQGTPANEPLAIGGLTTLEKVYSYNPTPASLSQQEAKHILGAQGNVWTEYIATPEQVEYMMMPRMAALAETVWTPENLKDYPDFFRRWQLQIPCLEFKKINFSKTSLQSK